MDSTGRKTCEVDDILHRDTLLRKSKYTYFLQNADGFVAHGVSDLGGVSGQVWAVIYSLVTFWRDCEYFCRGLPYNCGN